MDTLWSEEDGLEQSFWDEYSNQIIFPSSFCRASPKSKIQQDEYIELPAQLQSDTIDEDENIDSSIGPINQIMKITKKIEKKAQKNKRHSKHSNPIQGFVNNFITRVQSQDKTSQIHYLQQMKSLISNLESVLGGFKEQLLLQLQEKQKSRS